ncbi:MAG: lysylphosphatidylglycerol synthase transmembrane domain-containing protein [Deltaproteobacteria bacterium]|jgi:uncharacterized membrane protein YbhN (UPF0104 family)|nr:lysylphosphatidylglycerol synthase transmembrane domain-containing protein [Deltaproteobacteria bacterium]
MRIITKFFKKNSQQIIRSLSLIIGLLLFFSFIYFSGWDRIRQLGQLKLLPLVLIFIFTFGITSCVSFRWGGLVNAIGERRVAKWHEYYHYFIVSRVLGFVLPKDVTDFFGRTGLINRLHSLSIGRSGVSVILDRFFDLLSVLIFFCASLPYWLGFVDLGQGIALMVGLSLIIYLDILFFYRSFFKVLLWMAAIGIKFINQMPILKKISFNPEVFYLLDRKIISISLLLSALKFCLTALRFIFIASALQISIPVSLIVLGTPLGQLTYIIAITPGGLGIFEAGWFGILLAGGIDSGPALLFVVGQRILIVTCILFIFMIIQLSFFHNSIKKIW